MSISLLPESAPFNETQRAWLNGFLAGMLGIDESNPAVVDAAVGLMPAPEEAAAEDDDDDPWHDPGLGLDERMELADGKALPKRLMACMAQLDCGACGYLCKSYSEKIASGEEKNLKLCVPGGKETSKMLKQVLSESEGAATPAATAVAEKPATNGFSRQNPFAAKLIRSDSLNGEGSAKDVRHVEIDLAGSGLNYKVGDALGVYPTNCDELVAAILAEFETDGSEPCEINGDSLTFAEALNSRCCLKDVSDELLELMIDTAQDELQKTQLKDLVDSDLLDEIDVLDLLKDYPGVRPAPAAFIETLTALNPRLYSIASSQNIVGESVHLTVGRVIKDVRNRPRKGVASTMFSDRLQSGMDVKVFVHASHGFGVPPADDVPLIMVGPGTGIAPFRAFLQERQARKAPGKNWLFFGDQKSATDFLYREELSQFVESGLLTRLDTAFSRDQEEKIYVQNRMLENAEELFRWLEAGAWFTVCGDAKRMAVDVDRALHQIIEQVGGKSPEEAKAYVKEMAAAGRYLRDVY